MNSEMFFSDFPLHLNLYKNKFFHRYFCTYAALTVTLSFLMVVTFFVAIMTYDVRRIKSGRRDCIPLLLAPRPKEGMPAWDEPLPQTSNRVMKYWATLLMLPVTKVVVILLSLTLLAAGIYGVTQVEESFDRRILAKDDSYLKQFLTAQNKYFQGGMEVNLVETGTVDYKLDSTQKSIKLLRMNITRTDHYPGWIHFLSMPRCLRKTLLAQDFYAN